MECVSVIDAEHAGYISGVCHTLFVVGLIIVGICLHPEWRFALGMVFRRKRYTGVKPMSGMSYFDQYHK